MINVRQLNDGSVDGMRSQDLFPVDRHWTVSVQDMTDGERTTGHAMHRLCIDVHTLYKMYRLYRSHCLTVCSVN